MKRAVDRSVQPVASTPPPTRLALGGVVLPVVAIPFLVAAEAGDHSRPPVALRAGSPAPKFEARDDQGRLWRSSDHVGDKTLIVYFFPGDFTSGSTQQAIRFDRELARLRSKDVDLIGVSADSVETHRVFKSSHSINLTLLSDENGDVARKFGVRIRPGSLVPKRLPDQPPLVRKATFSWKVIAIDRAGNVADLKNRVTSLFDLDIVFQQMAEDFWSNRADKQPLWIPESDRHWKRLLTRQQYLVTRKHQTERPFSGKYYDSKAAGHYRCVGCGQVLFDSSTKFRSGTGWPSFWGPVSREHLRFAPDRSHGTVRIEVKCSQCDAHLGHVFGDGPLPTGHRYCINSAALVFDSRPDSDPANNEQDP